MNSDAEALRSVKKRIIELQKQMTSKTLLLAAEVEKLCDILPANEAREFLRVSCNVPGTEVSTYVGFAAKLKGQEDLLKASRVSFPVLKALVTADDSARQEIIARMELGTRIDTREISAIRKRVNEANLSRRQITEARNAKRLATVAKKNALARTSAFQDEVKPLVTKLLNAWPDGFEDAAASKAIRQEAASLQRKAKAIFGDHSLQKKRLPGTVLGRVLPVGYDALCRVAEGRFGSPEHFRDGHQQLTSDRNLVFALGELSGNFAHRGGNWSGPGEVCTTLPPIKKSLRTLELCAGAGGMAIGLERAGFKHVALVEFDAQAAATLRLNRPEWNVVQKDIRNIDFRGYRKRQIDLVAGGLPCQPYSQDGKGLGKDDPRDLMMEGVRTVREVKPRAFMFENVSALLHARYADHLSNVLSGFRKAGYHTEIHRLAADDYGIAQERTRILIIGVRKELAGALRMPPGFPNRRATLGDALEDLLAENGWSGAKQWAADRRKQPVFDKKGRVVATGVLASTIVTSRGKRRENENRLWLSKGVNISGLPVAAPTDEEGSAEGYRPGLTPRMWARLQNFPDDWQFAGGRTAVAYQIGNAVPPRLAQAAGLALHAALRNLEFDWEALLWPDDPRLQVVPPPLQPLELGGDFICDEKSAAQCEAGSRLRTAHTSSIP